MNKFKKILLLILIITYNSIVKSACLTPLTNVGNFASIASTAATYSPDGRFAASSSANGTISIFSTNSNGTLTPVPGSPFSFSPPGDNIDWVTYSPDGLHLAIIDRDSDSGQTFDVNQTTGAISNPTPFTTQNQPSSIAYSPNGKWAAVSNINSDTATVYNVSPTTGSFTPLTGNVATSSYATGVEPRSIDYSPDSRFAAVVNASDGTLSIFSVNQTTGAFTQIAGSPVSLLSFPLSVRYSPDGKFAAVANSGPDNITIFAVNSVTGLFTPINGTLAASSFDSGSFPCALSYSSNGSYLAALCSIDNTAYVWCVDTATGNLIINSASPQILTLPSVNAGNSQQEIKFSPSSPYLIVPTGGNDTVTVIQYSSCSVTISANATTICQGQSATLTAAATGSGTITYQWNLNGSPISGATSSTYSATIAGAYTVTITDLANCTQTSNTINITVNSNPTVTITTNPSSGEICNGQSITLTAHGADSYVWNTGATTTSITVSPTTTTNYSVTGTLKTTGCTDTANTTVTVKSSPTVSITTNPSSGEICNGQSITLTAHGADSYVWNTGATTTSITVSPTTTTNYSVTGTLKTTGCTDTANTTVTVNANPAVTITPSFEEINQGQTLEFTAHPSKGTAPYTFEWQKNGKTIVGQTGQVLTIKNARPSDTGFYGVIVTDTNGCQAQAQAEAAVIPFVVTIEPPSETVFQGQNIVLEAEVQIFKNANRSRAAFTYQWLHNGVILPNQTQQTLVIPNAQPSDAGVYTVQVASGEFTITASATVRVIPVAPLIVNIVPPELDICNGCTFTLTAEVTGGVKPYTFAWRGPNNFRATTQSITVTDALLENSGRYQVVVNDSLGHIATTTSVVTVNLCSPISKAIRSKYCDKC